MKTWMELRVAVALLAFLLVATTHFCWAQDESAQDPTIRKDDIRIEIYTHSFNVKGAPMWIPDFKFRVNDPIPEGSRLWMEVSYPGNKKWLTKDCGFVTQFRRVTDFACQFSGNYENKGAIRFLGLVDFVIHLTNELEGKELVLFQGKMKVAKKPKEGAPFIEYYVDEDWRIPIGYLFQGDRTLNFEVWLRTHWVGTAAYLFYQGKKMADGINCSGAPVKCEFFAGDDTITELKPGDYEIKVMKDNRLIRSAKFSVAEDGSYDNGIATANRLGSNKVIIPVSVLGTAEGPWNKLAWKTEAFYGNPLTGFTAPP